MANPNIAGTAASVYLRVACGPISTATGTSATLVVSCGTASSTVLRVTRLDVANVDGTNTAVVTIARLAGTNATTIVNTVVVPADAVLRVYDSEGSLTVMEGQEIRASANAAGDLTFDAEYMEFGG
jgi:hypothetical protein